MAEKMTDHRVVRLSVGRVNLIRYDVIEAARIANKLGQRERPVSWIGVRETKTSREPENS